MAVISALPAVSQVSSSALLPLVQNGVTVQAPISSVLALASPFALPSRTTTNTGTTVALIDASGNPYQVPLSALTVSVAPATVSGGGGGTGTGTGTGTGSGTGTGTGSGGSPALTNHVLRRNGNAVLLRDGTYLTFR